MFYTLAVASMFGFAVQNALLVRYARKMDSLSLGFYRNISFAVTLLPLLLLAKPHEVQLVMDQWHLLVVSGFSGAITLWLTFGAYRYLPVGVQRSYSRAITSILTVIAGFIFFNEVIEPPIIGLIVLIAGAGLWLGMQRNPMAHLDNRVFKGALMVLGASLLVTITKIVLTVISRTGSPLAGAYFWELSIAVAILIVGLLRWSINGQMIQPIDAKTFWGIALCSSPTLLGTGAYAWAITLGPLAIAETIGVGSLVITSLLASWLYKEKLNTKQWLAIALIIVGILGLKFF